MSVQQVMSVPYKEQITSIAPYNEEDALSTPATTFDGSHVSREISTQDFEDAVTEGLACEEYKTVLWILETMRRQCRKPNLATRWRWIRSFNAASGFSHQTRGTLERTAKNRMQLRLIDAMLRLAGPVDLCDDYDATADTLVIKPRWELGNATNPASLPTQKYMWKSEDTLSAEEKLYFTSKFRVALNIPGPERDRPNISAARYWTCENDTVRLMPETPAPTLHSHPVVPDLHCLNGVFSPAECTQILAAAKANGWDPDVPIDADGLKLKTIAYDFYWVIDDGFEAKLWNRIKHLVPSTYNGKAVQGVNRWFRIYEYLYDNEFPTHIDGAWPPSGIHPTTGEYLADASPPHAKGLSQLTFLIYLSDGFPEGGETAFFLPNATPGSFNVYPVQPVQGNVLVFPHGGIEQALWHEGISVSASVATAPKYVIRTELIYDT